MNSFDQSRVFTDFWAAQGQALMKVQEQAAKVLTDGMQAMASGAPSTMLATPTDLSAGAADLIRASRSIMDLWSAASALASTLATRLPAATGGDATVAATLNKMLDPRSWMAGTGEMNDVLGRMAEAPRLADLWEVERHYARVLQAWMNVRRRGFEHNAVVLEAWVHAGRRFTEELAGRTSAAAQAPDAKASLALWTETANQQLLETQRSEPFLRTQTAMIRASTELRMAQQELVEHFGKQYGFPTRTELDDVHRTVTELRREMRAMRREQRMAAQAPPPFAPAEARPSARRAITKQRPTR